MTEMMPLSCASNVKAADTSDVARPPFDVYAEKMICEVRR